MSRVSRCTDVAAGGGIARDRSMRERCRRDPGDLSGRRCLVASNRATLSASTRKIGYRDFYSLAGLGENAVLFRRKAKSRTCSPAHAIASNLRVIRSTNRGRIASLIQLHACACCSRFMFWRECGEGEARSPDC